MGNILSKQWTVWLVEYTLSFAVYMLIFAKCFIWYIKKSKLSKWNNISNSPVEDACNFATNCISQINSVICILLAGSIFYYKLWEDPVVKDIGLKIPFHSQSLLLSYLSADLISLIYIYIKYRKDVPIRYDTILHHIFGIFPFLMWEIPQPKFYWTVLSQYPGFTEISTIFLNSIWFSKFFNCPKNIRRKLKLGFVVSWFTVRLPCIAFMLLYTIYRWKEINKEYPNRIKYTIVVIWILMTSLQLIWTAALIYKTFAYFKGDVNVQAVHGQQLQLSSSKK